MRVVALGGEPGVGKSSVLRQVIEHLASIGFSRDEGVFVCTHEGRRLSVAAVELARPLVGDVVEHVIVLGRYDEGDTFPGTDRLSMGVHPAAEELVARLADHAARTPAVRVSVLFEGDRLFCRSFLLGCAATPGVEVRACVLTARPEQLEARRAGRGSQQSPAWLKGRASKVAGVVQWLRDSGEPVDVFVNDKLEALRDVAWGVVELLDLEGATC